MANIPASLMGVPVFSWTVNNVGLWLTESLNQKKYVSNFKNANVDGSELYELEEEDMEGRLEITAKGARKKIWGAIKKLKFSQAAKEANASAKAGGKGDVVIEKKTNVGKKKKKNVFGVNLHADKFEYDYGVTCTFCQDPEKYALLHCTGCKDFLCEDCDATVHQQVKRKNHVRTVISEMDMDWAGQRIQAFVRYLGCRNALRKKARATFDRFYDPTQRRHYYYNVNTGKVQWHKPYCLKSEELKPFMTYDVAAFKIQNLFHGRKAHHLVVELLQAQYNKIYDRDTGHFYYFYDGILTPTPTDPAFRVKSLLATPVQWKKPLILFSKDIKIVFTEDLAALRIQFAFRTMKAKQFMRILVRKFFQYCYDPITGKHYYRNTVNGHSMWRKPFSLGREKWDPEDVREWDVDEVVYFFRKLGFKKYGYCDAIKDYSVDGLLLLTFEWEDYNYLGITQSMHIKQTLLQLHRRKWFHSHIDHPGDIERRDRLRRHHNVDAAARLLQRKYRARYGRARFRALQEVIRLGRQKADREAAMRDGQNWWPHRVRDFSGLDPTIKVQHGKRRIFQTIKGWGNYEGDKFIPGPEALSDTHISAEYAIKLDKVETKFTGGDVTDALNAIDVSQDHIMGGAKKGASSKRFN